MKELLLHALQADSMLPMFAITMTFTLVLVGVVYIIERTIK